MAPGRLLAPTDEMRRHSWILLAPPPTLDIWGIIATVIPVANLYVMVFKP